MVALRALVSPSVQVSGSIWRSKPGIIFLQTPGSARSRSVQKARCGTSKFPTRSRSTSMAPPPSSIYASGASTNCAPLRDGDA